MTRTSILGRLEGKRGLLLEQVLSEGRAPQREQQIVGVAGVRGPLSRAQRRLYYLRKLDQSDASYNMTLAMHLEGRLSVQALSRAVEDLVVRHAALRSSIREDGEPYQEIVPSTGAKMRVEVCGSLSEARSRIAQEEARPFALDAGMFVRAFLFVCGPEEHVFALVIDHLVADGWSVGVISKDLSALYEHHLLGQPLALPELPVRFLDYAHWDNTRSIDLTESVAFWRRSMDGAEASVVPLDLPRPEVRPPVSGACHEIGISAEVLRGLSDLAQSSRTSLFSVLSAAFALFMKKYAFSDDVVIGTPAAGRFRWEVRDTVGFFVNTVPLRYSLEGRTSFADLLAHVHGVNQDGFAHQEVPYEQIVAETQPNRRRWRPLVNVLVCLQNLDLPDLRFGDVLSEPLGFARRTVRFDIELHYFLRGDGLLLHVAYDASLYRRETIEILARSVASFLEQVARGEDALSAVRFPSDVPRAEALAPCPVSRDPARFVSLPEIVVERMRLAPSAAAVRYGDVELTYGDLCDWADQIAASLAATPSHARIGLVFREGEGAVAASLGIWWSGRTLVPIDPDFPDDRVSALVRDADLAAVIDPAPDERLTKLAGAVALLALSARDPAAQRHGPPAQIDPSVPAYILYTSGSTGTPRGVLVTAGNLAGLAAVAETRFQFGPNDRWSWWHSCSFDVSIWDVWGAIATGGTVYPMSRWQKRDLGELAAFIDTNGITVLAQTPSVFYELAEALGARRDSGRIGRSSLRYVFLGGEAVEPQRLQRWFRAFGDAAPEVYNGYGITETTVYTTFRRLTREDAHRRWVASPIGRPLANVSYRIEDTFGDVVPVGGFGELVIGGESVSAGYLGRPEVTRVKFVERPWAGQMLRAYRSGDLVRAEADGELSIAGRIDHQVQLRGIRVEPGEIEAKILEDDRVGAVVVQQQNLDESEVRSLVAYVVPAAASSREWSAATGTWARVFDAAYAEPSSTGHSEWISSFTGLPYSEGEMAEWLDATLSALLALRPRRILEIGCGGGLLVRRLLPHVDFYCGIDVSKDAVARCAAIASELGVPPERYELAVGDAHAVEALAIDKVDLVIVNSVVQYFPDAGYLARALDLALAKLVDDGAIYVGDVRDLRLRETFYRDVERARSPGRPDDEIERAVRRRAEREGELLVHPDLFARYGELASLASVTVRSKAGEHHTEMNGYRFDALLRRSAASRPVGAARAGALSSDASTPAPPRDLVDDLRQQLAAALPDYMVPARFVVLSKLPRTVSGKIDRRALPVPGAAAETAAQPEVQDPIERAVLSLWAQALGQPSVGLDDDFFASGGHSLSAASLCSRLEAQLSVRIGLRALLARATPRAVSEIIRAASARAPEPRQVAPSGGKPADPFPLTDVQYAYWIGRQNVLALGDVAAHSYLEIDARELDVARFARAWQRAVERHGMLRCVVSADGTQRILEAVPAYEIRVHDLADQPDDAREAALRATRDRLACEKRPADVWPLFTVEVSKISKEHYRLHLSVDVLPLDGQSWQIVATDLARAYESDAQLPPAPDFTFRDYVLAVAARSTSPEYAEALDYWTRRAADLPGGPELPLARPAHQADQRSWKRLHHRVEPQRWRTIEANAQRNRLTPSLVLAAAYARVLGRYSKSQRFCLNVTLFNRLEIHPDVAQLAGDFTSLVPLEVSVLPREPFLDLTRRLESQLWSDLDRREVSGVRVLREVAKRRGTDAAKLPVVLTSTLSLEGKSALDALEELFGGKIGYGISQTPQVWLDHQIAVAGGALLTNWDFVEDLFPEGLIEAMFAEYIALVESLADPDAWTQDARPAAAPATSSAPERVLYEDFLAWAEKDPDRPALFYEQRVFSYGALLASASKVAEELVACGIEPEQPVLIACASPPEQVAAILGALLAGGWYVPVAASLPEARLGEIQRVVGARFALADDLSARFGPQCAVVVVRADEHARPRSEAPARRAARPEALAYVMFTSGSTGEPKGVAMEHCAAMHTIDVMSERFGIGPEDRVLALSALGFDLSVYDIFGALGRGGALVYPALARSRDPEEWDRVARERGVTLWNSVPALSQMYSDHLTGLGRRLPGSLRQVWWSGDWIPVELPGAFRALADRDIRVISLGGATEAGIWSIAFDIERVDPSWTSIPYGRALAGQIVDILDDRCDRRPDWVVGEICIGGASLARGYLGRPEETARRFVRGEAGGRWYRTGDLGRRWPDGTIEFLGREDGQVKVRGHRIETAEIEVRLARSPLVGEVAVVAWGPGNHKTELVAFVSRAPGLASAALTAGELSALRESLAAEVPEYLVPDRFVSVDRLPLNANGKVDRAALARRAAEGRGDRLAGEPPATETERLVAWAVGQVLGLPGAADDVKASFFEQGGDSVSAVRLLSLLNGRLGVAIPLAALFEAPTIRGLASRIESLGEEAGLKHSGPGIDKDDVRARRQKLAARRRER